MASLCAASVQYCVYSTSTAVRVYPRLYVLCTVRCTQVSNMIYHNQQQHLNTHIITIWQKLRETRNAIDAITPLRTPNGSKQTWSLRNNFPPICFRFATIFIHFTRAISNIYVEQMKSKLHIFNLLPKIDFDWRPRKDYTSRCTLFSVQFSLSVFVCVHPLLSWLLLQCLYTLLMV